MTSLSDLYSRKMLHCKISVVIIKFSVNVWLPKGELWYNVFTRDKLEGTGAYHEVDVTIDTFGLFARGGSIIPICNINE